MKHLSLRRARWTTPGVIFPVGGSSTWRVDYPVGYTRGELAAAAVGGYFFLNPGWRRSGFLFSHVRVTWTPQGWTSRVYFVGRPRRGRPPRGWRRWLRPSRPPRGVFRVGSFSRGVEQTRVAPPGVPRWGRVVLARGGRSAPWGETARVWRATRWVWSRIPHLRVGTLETLMNHLSYRIRGRFERRIRGVALPLLGLTRRIPTAVGAHLRCSGRFTRRPRGETQNFTWGVLRRGTPSTRVEQSFLTVPLRFGAVGVTLTVAYE